MGRTERAGECDACGHPVCGMIVVAFPGEDPTVMCDECGAGDEFGVFVKPRREDETRAFPDADGGFERLDSLSP